MVKPSAALAICITLAMAGQTAFGATSPPQMQGISDSVTLAGVLQRETIRLGYRDSSVPFSYTAGKGEPMGFAIDLCRNIVESIAQELKLKRLGVEWVPVTSSTRISLMKEGKIELECGSTTNTAERRRQVAFTIPHYIAGVRILSRSNKPLTNPSQLEGRNVSTNNGSTAAEMLEFFNQQLRIPIKLQLFSQSLESFSAVQSGKAEAWVHDDIQLFSQRAMSASPGDYVISNVHLSIEPLAIMLPKDDAAFKALVDRTMRSLMRAGEVRRLYSKWFEEPIPPKGINLQVPLNSLTKDLYRSPTDYVPDLRILRMQ
jgi:ABC-type amino acid transport substrate-binding protein